MTQNRVWRLRHRPVGDIKDSDLELVSETLPPLAEGEYLLQINYLSLDPTNRIWMSDMEQYMQPVGLGDPMRGGIAGTVVASNKAGVNIGDTFGGLGGWADYLVTDGAMMQQIPRIPGVSLATLFGSLGMVGTTAYFGVVDILKPKPGETVVVSAAAGAVGSIAAQYAKRLGARVIGIAGSAEKCRWLVEECGLDGAINYKAEDVGQRLDVLAPDGIDGNFENVGGEIMEAVMARMAKFGRMALCGMISTYNSTAPIPGPRAWPLILMRSLTVKGFIVIDYADRYSEAASALAPLILSGQIKTQLDIRDGLENALTSVRDLYSGANTGKLMIRVAPE
jgi:NADPH-dependent curcumin reductase